MAVYSAGLKIVLAQSLCCVPARGNILKRCKTLQLIRHDCKYGAVGATAFGSSMVNSLSRASGIVITK